MENNKGLIFEDKARQRRRFLRLFGTAAALLPITMITGCSDDKPAPPAPASTPDPKPAMRQSPPAQPEPPPEPAPPETAEGAASGADQAQQMPELSLDDPTAKALGYKHDADNVDAQKYPQRSANQYCRNCALFQSGSGDTWGPCTLFPGRRVNANGWCSGYTPKPT